MGHWRRSDCSWMVSFREDLLERVQQGCNEIISSVGCEKRGRGYVKILVMNYYCLQYIFSVLIFRFIERAIF